MVYYLLLYISITILRLSLTWSFVAGCSLFCALSYIYLYRMQASLCANGSDIFRNIFGNTSDPNVSEPNYTPSVSVALHLYLHRPRSELVLDLQRRMAVGAELYMTLLPLLASDC